MNIKAEATDWGETRIIHVVQGDFRVSQKPGTVLTTLLGSCVATCLSDPEANVGGMNHFLLPGGNPGDSKHFRYGLYAMEILVNALLKLGARKNRLEAKLFGGATMHDGLGRIGAANGAFALQFLSNEGIPCVAKSLGGTQARRVRFLPTVGRAQQIFVQDDVVLREIPARLPVNREDDDVTFF